MALVKINLKDIFDSGFSARVVFAPLETPWIKGDWAVVASRTTEVTTNTSGLAEATLLPGRYRVTFPRYTEDVLEIAVPDDDEEYNFALLIDAGGDNIPTPPHWQGPQGEAATITVDSTETLSPGEAATVENVGDENDAALKFGIPKGDKGDDGNAATVSVGTVETVAPGQPAEVVNAGTSSAAILNFKIPRGSDGEDGEDGAAATISVASTTTGEPGTEASVTNTGTARAAVLAFTIPRGNAGTAATVEVGDVATGEPGSSATVDNVGSSSAAVLNFSIPKGETGDPGQDYVRAHEALTGTVIDLSSGSDIIYYATLSGAVTYTFDSPANGTIALISFSNAGGHAVTWPGTVQWMMGVPPPSVLPDGCMVTLMVVNGVVIGGWA